MDPDLSRLSANTFLLPLTLEAVIPLLIAFLLLLLFCLFSISEMVYTSLNPEDFEEKESDSDNKIKNILRNIEQLPASISLCNHFILAAIVVLSAYGCSQLIPPATTPFLWESLLVLCLLLLFVTIRKILPIVITQKNALKFTQFSLPIVHSLFIVCRPVSAAIIRLSRYIQDSKKKKTHDISVDELSKALQLTSEEIKDEKDILEGIIKFHEKTVMQIMTSKIDIFSLDLKTGFREIIEHIVAAGYSRIPVYANTLDTIKGVLYIKDLLPYLEKPDSFRWQSLIRPAFFIPETKKIDDLLEEFRTNKTHLAIVVDEFGDVAGVVSLEDVLEEIVGEISDEYDDEDSRFQKLADGSFIFEAKTQLSDFFRITGINPLDFDEFMGDIETIAGLILEIKGSFPNMKEVIDFGNYSFQILEINQRRISKIKLSFKGDSPDEINK